MKKSILLVCLLVLVLSMLAACGGGGSKQPAAQPPAEQKPAAAQPAPAMAKGDPVKGKEAFTTCAGCHGPDGKGLPNLGKDMTTSTFIAGKTDEELLAFVKTGRPVGDPANTTGVAMPPKGGNPALTDAQIMDIVAYIRSIHQ